MKPGYLQKMADQKLNNMDGRFADLMKCDRSLVMALTDTLNVVSGKWKLAIVCTLLNGKRRFSDIQRTIGDITPRMVSKELKELEVNGVIQRTVIKSTPVLIEYELTPSGLQLYQVIIKMVEWGVQHREITLNVPSSPSPVFRSENSLA